LQMIAGATGFAPWTDAQLNVPKYALSRDGTNALFVSTTPGESTDLSVGRLYVGVENLATSLTLTA